MGTDSLVPIPNTRPNEVTLPPWRVDNVYSFVWSLIIAVATATAAAVGTYYSVVRAIDKTANVSDSDIRLIRQDVAYIKEKIDNNAVLSEKKLDDHIGSTNGNIQRLNTLELKVAQIEAKLR